MAKGKGKAKKPGKKEREEAEAKKRLEEEEAAAEENDIEFQKAILEIRVKELEQLKVGYGKLQVTGLIQNSSRWRIRIPIFNG